MLREEGHEFSRVAYRLVEEKISVRYLCFYLHFPDRVHRLIGFTPFLDVKCQGRLLLSESLVSWLFLYCLLPLLSVRFPFLEDLQDMTVSSSLHSPIILRIIP